MGGVDFDSHRNLVGASVNCRGHRTQGFRQYDVSAPVKEPDNLPVSLHWHAGHGSLSPKLQELNTHFSG
jgi:hypothetical protein